MSTPTTATATLPPYGHIHQNPYSFSHSSYPSASSYRTAASGLIPATSRLGPSAYSTPTSNTTYTGANSTSRTNGLSNGQTSTTSARRARESTDYEGREDGHYTTMPTGSSRRSGDDTQPARKRRRSQEPDWNTFYKNGLPREIIVIDDTPEPDVAATTVSQRPVNGVNGTNGPTNGVNGDSTGRHLAKKRRRDEVGHYDPVRNNISHNGTTPQQYATPSGSTISSDRTNSAHQTTAATSLGSSSSNGHYEHESQVGAKRKRTRQQIANEAKRRELGAHSSSYHSYQPPPHPPKKAADVHVKVVTDHHSYSKPVRVDDDDGHYIVVPDAKLTDRYTMVKLLGQGTFGKVVQARDHKRNNGLVAIKIIRSVQKYRDASKIELRVLATLKANDEENRNRCIHLRDCFDYQGHICIVMDLLGQSVFDFLKSNNFVPFPNSQIQSFARQLFTSVAFLHDLNLIHTDLKPENILLCNNEYQTFTYNRKIPSSSSTITRQATQRRVLLDTEIRLIDFGSATFQDEYHSSVVSTRHYRAPEIILGLGWSFPCDIWSVGCILVEFFTGDALFQTHDNLEHLAMMEAVCNARIDTHLVTQVNKMTRNGGNPAAKYFKRLKLDYPTTDTTRASRRFVKAMKRLEEIIPSSSRFLQLFLDLLQKIFVYDPARRLTAKAALNHPFFKENAHADDGTEARKLWIERLRAQEASRLAPIHVS